MRKAAGPLWFPPFRLATLASTAGTRAAPTKANKTKPTDPLAHNSPVGLGPTPPK